MSKIKKMLSFLLAATLTAGVTITGTMAYLTSEDSNVNVMTLGNVKIEQHEYQRAEGVAHNAGEAGKGNGIKKGDLVDFVPNQALYPAVPTDSTAYTAEATDLFYWGDYIYSGTAGNGLWNDEKLSNVMDKMVFVENSGKTDAYVRTIIAFECPEGMEYSEGSDKEFMMNVNMSETAYSWEELGYETIDGIRYLVMEATYLKVLEPGNTAHPSLLQVVMTHNATNEDMELLGDTYEIIVVSQAVQADGFADAKTALDEAFGVPDAVDATSGAMRCAEWFGEAIDTYEASLIDTWDGAADTSWYNDTDIVFSLTTAEQFAGFGKLVDEGNTFADKCIKLDTDLDLYLEDENGDRVSFNPIGYGYDVVFKGTFDGQDHTIFNLYQNGWALGYDYSTEAGGLFASVVDATIKNLTIDKSEIVMECIDMGTLVGYSYGNCTYENISVTNSSISNYNRYTGGVIGEVNGVQTFKNVDVDAATKVRTLWGSFDTSVGGIVGGKYGDATLTFEDCDVACQIDAYNDITATPAGQWCAYRRAGMLIGNTEECIDNNGTKVATASYLTANNCTVTYGDWVNYTYCEFGHMSNSWPHCRVQPGGQASAYTNARYGVAKDLEGNPIVDDNHVHAEGEDHNRLMVFDQLFGGDVGVYGGKTQAGVTVVYNNK